MSKNEHQNRNYCDIYHLIAKLNYFKNCKNYFMLLSKSESG